jgi:hypothetical protein
MGRSLPLLPEAKTAIIAMAGGDGRYLLDMAEQVYAFAGVEPLDMATMGITPDTNMITTLRTDTPAKSSFRNHSPAARGLISIGRTTEGWNARSRSGWTIGPDCSPSGTRTSLADTCSQTVSEHGQG